MYVEQWCWAQEQYEDCAFDAQVFEWGKQEKGIRNRFPISLFSAFVYTHTYRRISPSAPTISRPSERESEQIIQDGKKSNCISYVSRGVTDASNALL